MTAHQLAKELLAGPDLPVVINGWGSDEGNAYETAGGEVGHYVFNAEMDDQNTPRGSLGYKKPRPAIQLDCVQTEDWA